MTKKDNQKLMDIDIRHGQGRNYRTPRPRKIRDRYFEKVQAQYWYPVKKDKVPEENKPKAVRTPKLERQIAIEKVSQVCYRKETDLLELSRNYILTRRSQKGSNNHE